MTNLPHALAYAAAGLYVYPGDCDTKLPHRMLNGRAPKGLGGFNLATRDPELIRHYWSIDPEARVMANPAMSGHFVADDDTVKKGTVRPALPATPFVVITRSGGEHHWYRVADGGLVPGGIADTVDIVHRGGVVLPTPGSGYEPVDHLTSPLDAIPWPQDHPWPRRWRGQRRAGSRSTPPRSALLGGELPEPVAVELEHAELRRRFALIEVKDRSRAAWALMLECRGAGMSDDAIATVMANYRPLRDRCAERADPAGALEDWIDGQLELLDEYCPHAGRNCVEAGCRNAGQWLLSHIFTPGMRRIRDELVRDPVQSFPVTETLRQSFGPRIPAWQAKWIVDTGAERGYWTVESVRIGTRGPATRVLRPCARVSEAPWNVDPTTGEILSDFAHFRATYLAKYPFRESAARGSVLSGERTLTERDQTSRSEAIFVEDVPITLHSETKPDIPAHRIGFGCQRCPGPAAYSKCGHQPEESS